jgi:hypothetical protein
LALERLVVGGGLVAHDCVRDVGVDVERRGAGGPVARALLSADRPPRERRAPEPQLPGALLGELERQASPAQRVCHDMGSGVGQHRQDERLGVPEGVTFIAGARQPLCGDRPLLTPGTCLKSVKQREPNRLLHFRVSLEFDVRTLPEVVQVRPLLVEEAVPASVPRRSERRGDLVTDRRHRALARPAVGEELD